MIEAKWSQEKKTRYIVGKNKRKMVKEGIRKIRLIFTA